MTFGTFLVLLSVGTKLSAKFCVLSAFPNFMLPRHYESSCDSEFVFVESKHTRVMHLFFCLCVICNMYIVYGVLIAWLEHNKVNPVDRQIYIMNIETNETKNRTS